MGHGTDPERVIRSQVVLEEHDVSDDGRFAVVVRRFVRSDRYRSHLWLVPLDPPGPPRQLTSGPVRDTWPRIAPGGGSLAFRRSPVARRDDRAGLAGSAKGAGSSDPSVMILALDREPARPGRARPQRARPRRPWPLRTPPRRAVSELAWAPDGRRLALAMEEDALRFVVGGEPPRGLEPLARRITRIDWRLDEAGHLDRHAQVFVVDARRGARPRQLTTADWDVTGLAWSPDGGRIAFAADPRPDADVRPRRSIWTVSAVPPRGDRSAATGDAAPPAPVEVLALGGDVHSPAWSPDGRRLAAIGFVARDALDDTSPTLVVGPADGRGPAVDLAPELDRPVGSWVDTDLYGWIASQRSAPCWLDDRTLVAIVSDRGRAGPWRFEADERTGGQPVAIGPAAAPVPTPVPTPVPMTTTDLAAVSLAVARRAGPGRDRVTLLACVGNRPLELVSLGLADGRVRRRTRMGGRWAAGLDWPVMQSVRVPGPGGPFESWIASPADAPSGPLPTVVDVHGGPLGAWAPAPSIEVVLLCARGYRVVLPNIRGSATYGRDHITPQLGDWGGVDAADVHAALDHAIELGLADPDRLGVLGLSYGGFMVNWLVGTSRRFRAAVSENGASNQVAAWANSDTGVEFNRMARLGTPLDAAGVEQLWRQSPLANVADVTTPLLMLQAGADLRCPPGDNEQLFIALRVLRRSVEYVLYPEESHVYQASGRPDRRIDRMARMLDWFDRYLRA